MGSEGTVFILFRCTLIAIFDAIATYINTDNLQFIKKFEPIVIWIITGLIIFDYYVTQISGSQFLFRVWWMASAIIAQGITFIVITLSKRNTIEYTAFYKRFWLGFTPLYIFVLILCFARNPFGKNLTTNFILGQGTIQMLIAFIKNVNVSFEAPLIFFGNLVIFVPLAFIINVLFKSLKNKYIALIGTAVPFLIEGYQYIFSCGDVDIDDIVLNLAGFYIGYIIMIINNTTIKNEE